jgi:hypothetical protein
MRPPRGLKKILKSTSPVRLSGSGRFRGFELLKQGKPTNIKLSGLTKRLDTRLFSNGSLPSIAIHGTERRTAWKGKSGGRKRGSAVDAQLTRCINAGKVSPQKGYYSLTKLVLLALSESGLIPVMAQRGCCCVKNRVATAADIVCYNMKTNRITVVELKCGFSGSRTTAAMISGTRCYMKTPLEKASDCVLNRHMAQLAITRHLIESEATTLSKIASLGVDTSSVDAVLLYANEESCDFLELPDWWKLRSNSIIQHLK